MEIVRDLPDHLAPLFGPKWQGPPPGGGRWSAGGYLWHLVDVLRIGSERMLTLRYDPAAGLPCWDENALAEVRQYERLSQAAGVHALRGAAGEWVRTARDAPAAATAHHHQFGAVTADGGMRRNAHEAVHHELDIRCALDLPRQAGRD